MAEAALIAKLVACGLNPIGISIRYENDLQSEVVKLSRPAAVSEAHFECIYEAARGAFVEFDDQKIKSAYAAFEEKAAKSWMRKESISWLKAHGKYENVPVLFLGQDPRMWARAVEAFCGLREGEAIEFPRSEFMTLKRSFLSMPPRPELDCLMNVIWLSDFSASGVSFGFIGNEAFAKEHQ